MKFFSDIIVSSLKVRHKNISNSQINMDFSYQPGGHNRFWQVFFYTSEQCGRNDL